MIKYVGKQGESSHLENTFLYSIEENGFKAVYLNNNKSSLVISPVENISEAVKMASAFYSDRAPIPLRHNPNAGQPSITNGLYTVKN